MTNWIIILGWIGFYVLSALAIAFIVTFLSEREWGAAIKGILIFATLLTIFAFLLIFDFPAQTWIVAVLIISGLLIILLFTIPKSHVDSVRVVGEQTRIDERDALFHRFYRIKPGTLEFENYYRDHPEKIKIDEAIRELPLLGWQDSKSHHKLASLFQMATFDIVKKLTREIDWQPEPIAGKPVEASPGEFTTRIKGFAKYLGADLVGITKLNPAYVYSHIGRSPGKWGEPIQLDHHNAIAIAIEQDYEMIKHSPDSATTTESSCKYFDAAKIAMTVAKYINLLGYEARAHVDGNYRIMCVPIAVDAGLGELGRLGLLVTPKFGPRVRIAIITTDLPLNHDKPGTFGVQHFCSICKKCATNCPSASVETGDKNCYAGVEKWQSNQENCYRFWRIQGTDCAICIKLCPYSNPNTIMHNLIRWFIQRNNFARRLMFWGDRIFYGQHRRTRYPLPDWHQII